MKSVNGSHNKKSQKHSQLALLVPLDIRRNVILQRRLVLFLAEGNRREAVVCSMFAFRQKTFGSLNCNKFASQSVGGFKDNLTEFDS
jgi:hypothetical protein